MDVEFVDVAEEGGPPELDIPPDAGPTQTLAIVATVAPDIAPAAKTL
jgi:hypothetical protein